MTAEKHHEEPAMEQPVPVVNEDAKNAGKKKGPNTVRNFVLGGLLAVVVLGLGLVTALTAGLYKFGWSGPAATTLVHALPYPIALVNSNPISYAEYLDDVETLKHFYDKQAPAIAEQGGTMPTDEEIRQNVMERLVRNEVLKEEAVKFNVSVSDEDVAAEFARLVGQAGDEATVQNDVQELYGWTTEQFKEKVLRPYLLEQALAAAVGSDQALNADAEAKAKEVMDKVKAGGDFAELAKQYSSDYVSGQNGGDLGWFERGTMVKEFEDAAFGLKKGDISEIVRTNFGYHIIKVEDIEETDGQVTRVSARHILIPAATVEEYVQKAIDGATVKKLIEI